MFKNIIVSAANKFDVYKNEEFIKTIVVCDAFHFGTHMHDFLDLLEETGYICKPNKEDGDRGQGFIDECGKYYNRSQAYYIAKKSG